MKKALLLSLQSLLLQAQSSVFEIQSVLRTEPSKSNDLLSQVQLLDQISQRDTFGSLFQANTKPDP